MRTRIKERIIKHCKEQMERYGINPSLYGKPEISINVNGYCSGVFFPLVGIKDVLSGLKLFSTSNRGINFSNIYHNENTGTLLQWDINLK